MNLEPAMLQNILAINRRRFGLDPENLTADQQFSNATGAGQRLCVYGKMRPGGPSAHLLEGIGGEWAEARFPGFLQSDGVCTLDQCPGLAWSPSAPLNNGFLFRSQNLESMWSLLDGKEGADYARILTPVQSEGQVSVANIYVSRDATLAQLLMLDGMNVHDDVD